ncbi:MAG: R3H domain-containing nucleic acid-binding protein [Cyanobacteria bacterium P01_E01_bin.6]
MTLNSHSNFSLKRPQFSRSAANHEAPPENLEVHEWVAADDLSQLLDVLPHSIRDRIEHHPNREKLIEIVMDLGRQAEVRFPDKTEYLTDEPITADDLQHCVDRIGEFSGDNRAGIEQTLHRISAMRNRSGKVIGLTCRVGRAIFGTIGMIRDLVGRGNSILMLGRPGVGKTTALREIARVLADEFDKRVVIIDTSNEIAGDGDVPHPAIGRARRMQVARPELQHQVMIEAVENHMPEVIVIDEIGTELEALAARTIAERGVQLVGTAHGNRIDNLMKNPTLSDLVGGIQSVTLGDDEARRRGSQKSVLERKAPPTFEIAIEMLECHKWVVHENVAETVDHRLRGHRPDAQVRTVQENGTVAITHEAVDQPSQSGAIPLRPLGDSGQGSASGWRSTGRMTPVSGGSRKANRFSTAGSTALAPDTQSFSEMLDASLSVSFAEMSSDFDTRLSEFGTDGEGDLIRIYPYGVSRQNVEQVIQTLNFPVELTKDIDSAHGVLALRSHVKNHSKLRHMAKVRQLPIHTVKSNSVPQIIRGLQRLLNMDNTLEESIDLNVFSRNGDDNEIEALEEARLAVEQIVIPKGQPVELLPRSATVRKMQHELVEHYRLKSTSLGDEPNRRLRIYPA